MLMCLALGVAIIAPHRFDFYAFEPYEHNVPTPDSILGYGPGERQTVYRDQERVVDAIVATARDRAQLFRYGKSAEGRPLRIGAIRSPDNIARPEQIQDKDF